MNIETKFNLGDTAWLIHFDQTRTPKPCPDCEGAGRLTLKDGKDILCRHCYSRGTLGFTDDKSQWFVRGMLTLGRVTVQIVRETLPGECLEDFESDNFGPQEASRNEEYMAYETGIGTGSCWKADDLFVTKEEAHAECDRRNGHTAGADL